MKATGIIGLIGTIMLAIAGTAISLSVDWYKANKKIVPSSKKVPGKSGHGFDVGYHNPSTTNYRCEEAWFIWTPTDERLRGAAIESDTIVFDGTKWKQSTDGTVYLHQSISDKQMKAGDNGSFHVVIVDPRKAGQTVTGILQIRYNRNGKPTTENFGPMSVVVQSRP